jgi:NADH:ubiquinone reductase (H+-translocating)
VQASPAAQWLDAPADRVGRLKVAPDLTAPGHPEIFAVGDAAIVARPDGRPVPGIAPAAKLEGAYVAQVIRARLAGEAAPPPFRYKHAGDLATIGKRRAVIDFGWIKLRAAIARWLWGFAHLLSDRRPQPAERRAQLALDLRARSAQCPGSSPGGVETWRECRERDRC